LFNSISEIRADGLARQGFSRSAGNFRHIFETFLAAACKFFITAAGSSATIRAEISLFFRLSAAVKFNGVSRASLAMPECGFSQKSLTPSESQ